MVLGTLSALVLAATAPLLSDTELPPPPFVDVPAIEPAPVAPPAPIAPPAVTPKLAPTAPSLPAPDSAESAPLLGPLPWVEGGFGGVDAQLTSLNGATTVITQVSVDAIHQGWTAGAALVAGGSDLLAMRELAFRGGYGFARSGPVTFSAGLSLGLGWASRVSGEAVERVSLVSLAPELTARTRLLPWLGAHGTVSYRFVNAGDWTGPSGDAMGGLGLGIGLDFGQFGAVTGS